MAPLPTIPNCVRIAINWSQSAGVRPVNVFHIVTASTDEAEIAEAIGDAFIAAGANVFACVQDGFTIDTYTITLLDGSSAGQVVNEARTIGGQASGDPIPAVAGVLSFHTAQRGPRGRGRMYLGPIGEGIQAGGILSGSVGINCAAAWQDVDTELGTSSINGGLVVASYVHAEAGAVTSISMRPQVGTQRRRQNQLV